MEEKLDMVPWYRAMALAIEKGWEIRVLDPEIGIMRWVRWDGPTHRYVVIDWPHNLTGVELLSGSYYDVRPPKGTGRRLSECSAGKWYSSIPISDGQNRHAGRCTITEGGDLSLRDRLSIKAITEPCWYSTKQEAESVMDARDRVGV
jgi:hypothetical protein